MREDIWIQNKKLIPFFGDELIHFLTNFQHILFLPVIFLAGRVGIVIDSTVTERKFRPWSEHATLQYIVSFVRDMLTHYIAQQPNLGMSVTFSSTMLSCAKHQDRLLSIL
jgi:hypothetical protein